jgi:single-stranded-DNA-specific exonuclease
VSYEQQWILRRTGLDPVLAQVLWARGIDTPDKIQAFLTAEQAPLGDPLEMADMGAAVERICRAIEAGERVRVYGDFDVDGVTSAALLVSVLRDLGADAEHYIPDRFLEGYGLNCDALNRIGDEGYSLCIAVDCGVRSVEEVRQAQAQGLDMIIIDHHTAPEELPPAVAVVDPKRDDSAYPFQELAGVGVTYQLCRALCAAMQGREAGRRTAQKLDSYLDLVALGTVADIVPLEGENRTLARRGLEQLRRTTRPGLLALMEQAGIKAAGAGSIDIAFRLAPRLNASGRMEHAEASYALLMAQDMEEARERAASLDVLNDERQRTLESQTAVARAWVDSQPLAPILIVEGPDYHEGIVGLIASRLREAYYRPTLVLRRDDATGQARGSARSVEGFHITRALDACSDLLIRYGGHAQAAGFLLAVERLPAFRERLLAYAQEHLDQGTLTPRLLVDAIVPLRLLSANTVRELERLEPFGRENPEPVLATRDVEIVSIRPVGQEGKHLRLSVRQEGVTLPCIAFRKGELAQQYAPGSLVDLVYSPSMNEWQGTTSLQLVIMAIRPAGAS